MSNFFFRSVCDDPKQLDTSSFTCEDSGHIEQWSDKFGCSNTYDGDESSVWQSYKNKYERVPGSTRDGKEQLGFNTNVKIIFGKETIVSGVQIINKADREDYFENYKVVKLEYSNGHSKEIELANGKQNPIFNLETPVETSFVNVVGISTWGRIPDSHSWLDSRFTGYECGFSEIRVFGCEEGR